jgi:hypothetical protein
MSNWNTTTPRYPKKIFSWSTGEQAIATETGVQYVVDGVNGENAIRAVSPVFSVDAARPLCGMVPPAIFHS